MTYELDCRGLDCPAPVLQVKAVLDQGTPSTVAVLVDNEAAWQNVSRLLEHQNFTVSTERQGADYRVVGLRKEGVGEAERPAGVVPGKRETGLKKILILVGSARMGHGDEGLGAKLMINFLKTAREMGPDLWRLVFINSGVTLTVEGAESLPILQALAGEGVQILVCGACLTHFNLLHKKQVGETTNMLDIVTGMQLADSVVTI